MGKKKAKSQEEKNAEWLKKVLQESPQVVSVEAVKEKWMWMLHIRLTGDRCLDRIIPEYELTDPTLFSALTKLLFQTIAKSRK